VKVEAGGLLGSFAIAPRAPPFVFRTTHRAESMSVAARFGPPRFGVLSPGALLREGGAEAAPGVRPGAG
jgi:hypothetical protein